MKNVLIALEERFGLHPKEQRCYTFPTPSPIHTIHPFIPRGVVHNFKNVGSARGKILVSLFPGGHENFLKALSEVAAGGKPDMAKMAAVASLYDVEILTR